MICVFINEGSTRRLTESGFMWFYGEAGNLTCDPWFRLNLITLVGFSPNLISWVVGIYSFAKLKKMDFTCH